MRRCLPVSVLTVVISCARVYAGVTYAVQDLGTLEGTFSTATDINSAGDVVGGTDTDAFIYRNGVLTGLNAPFGTRSTADAINSSGQIAVRLASSSGKRSFLLTNGTYTDLGDFGGSATQAAGLNDRGEVVGFNPNNDRGRSSTPTASKPISTR